MAIETDYLIVGAGATGLAFADTLLDYDLGPGFDAHDASGIVSVVPPRVRRAIKTLVPRVDADGNELGGVPLVLRDAPLGTYVGWNVVADGFHRGKACDYAGGMIPFARSRAERVASGDPRLSLDERYGSHAGYVEAVRKAAEAALAQGFLLPAAIREYRLDAIARHSVTIKAKNKNTLGRNP